MRHPHCDIIIICQNLTNYSENIFKAPAVKLNIICSFSERGFWNQTILKGNARPLALFYSSIDHMIFPSIHLLFHKKEPDFFSASRNCCCPEKSEGAKTGVRKCEICFMTTKTNVWQIALQCTEEKLGQILQSQ